MELQSQLKTLSSVWVFFCLFVFERARASTGRREEGAKGQKEREIFSRIHA